MAVTIKNGVRLQTLPDGAISHVVSSLGQVDAVTFASDEELIAGALNELFVFKIAGCKVVSRTSQPLPMVTKIAVAPDASWGAMASRKDLYYWRSRDGGPQNLRLIGSHSDYVSALAISSDGKTLVSGGADRLAYIWRVSEATMRIAATISGHAQTITSVAVADDLIATTSMDRTARLWRLTPGGVGQILLERSSGYFFKAEFSPDASRLAVAGYDGVVRVWDTSLDNIIQRAKTFAGRNLSRCEWSALYGDLPYRRTFSDLPEPTSNRCQPTQR
jgi:WD40 repeat protein